MQEEKQHIKEKKRRRTAWIVGIGVHLALLVIFFFTTAWEYKYPPEDGTGVVINFDEDVVEKQSANPSSSPEVTEQPEEPQPEQPQPTEEAEELPDTEGELTEPENTPQPADDPDPQPQPDPTPQPAEDPTPSPNPDQMFNPGDIGEKPDDGKDDESGASSVGVSDIKKQGWSVNLDVIDRDNSKEKGYIDFEIEINDKGEIKKLVVGNKSVSAATANFYKEEIIKKADQVFKKKPGATTPPLAKGTFRFYISE